MPRFKGVTLKIGEQEFVIPPLSLGQIREFQDLLEAKDLKNAQESDSGFDYMLKRLPVIHAALKRNYPEITIEELCDMIDLSNFNDVLRAVMNVSGMEKAAGSEGEKQPVQVQ